MKTKPNGYSGWRGEGGRGGEERELREFFSMGWTTAPGGNISDQAFYQRGWFFFWLMRSF